MEKRGEQPGDGAVKAAVHVAILRDAKVDVGIPPGKVVVVDAFTDEKFSREVSAKCIIFYKEQETGNRQIGNQHQSQKNQYCFITQLF